MPLQKMPLKIEGVDFSDLTERCGYSIVYEDRKGANSMTMQNGDEYQDIIVRKPILTWRLDSLTNADLSSLINAIKTAYFHGTISAQEVGVIRNGGYYRFKAPTLTMRAR